MDISTRNLDALPPPKELRNRCLAALAILDEALSPDWEMRHDSFDPKWGKGALMASMRNGSGDDYFVGFCKAGVFVKGFDHESVNKTKPGKPAKACTKGTKNGAPETGGAKRVRIAGGSGRIPDEILDTLGPACPGAVELLIAARNR